MYTWYHKVHHAYHDIICIHAICAHMVELYSVMGLIFITSMLTHLIIGIHPLVAYVTPFLLTAHNIVSHSGYDDHLEDLTLGLISGSKMHIVHHQMPKYNFGFFTYIWDYVFGTKLTHKEMLERRPNIQHDD
jgi:sterol desaturase/sphingolipid hydroxylase (fatty acid hydroxylase superfamily)